MTIPRKLIRFTVRSVMAGAAVAVGAWTFTAYLDPAVFLPMLGGFALCQ
jgi:hypothetical protein